MWLEVLNQLFGVYVFQAISFLFTLYKEIVCQALFARRMERRPYFWLRSALLLLFSGAFCYLLSVWHTEAPSLGVRVACYLLIGGLVFVYLCFTRRENMEDLLMAFCKAQATHWFAEKLYAFLQLITNRNPQETMALFHPGTEMNNWDLLLFAAFYFGIYILFAALFRSRARLTRSPRVTRNIVVLSVSTIALVNVFICVTRPYEGESRSLALVVNALYILACLFILLLSNGMFSVSAQEQDLDTLRQLWRQDRDRFASVKANMDAINMKCHDLKHILNKIEGKLTGEEADSLREALEFYDSSIRTGSEVLDVVLCEKALTCRKNGIAFSCMADGSSLGFLPPARVYTLFGNIMDNAIEAVSRVEDEERRVISLTCRAENGALLIEESNYFAGAPALNGETSKADKSRHGYGLKSIEYIAGLYGGSSEISPLGDMFFLNVRIPLEGKNARA